MVDLVVSDDTGEGLFVPPSLFHVAAQGRHLGLLRMQYEGHGLHASIVQPTTTPSPTPLDNNDLAQAGTPTFIVFWYRMKKRE